MALLVLFPPSSPGLSLPTDLHTMRWILLACFKLDLQLRLIGAFVSGGIGQEGGGGVLDEESVDGKSLREAAFVLLDFLEKSV